MKTIAAAAMVLMLSAPAWADEPESNADANSATTDEPTVLREAEMDGVTAAGMMKSRAGHLILFDDTSGSSTSTRSNYSSYTYDASGNVFGLND